jgi:hypothetical protein
MKKSLFFLVTFLFANGVFAQSLRPVAQKITDKKSMHAVFEYTHLFSVTAASKQHSEQLKNRVSNSTVMEFNRVRTQAILSHQPENLRLFVPKDAGQNIELELVKVNLFTPDFSVTTSESNGLPVAAITGLHYQGIVKGDNSSIVAISIFGDEVMGMISTAADGNITLGKLENDFSGRHILYRQRDFVSPPSSGCFTPEYPMTYSPAELQFDDANRTVNCVRLYWEANYDLYVNKGSSVSNVVNYLTGLFNQSNTIYANDGISTVLSEIYVWNTTSPYTGTSTSSLLSQFQSYRNSFNGDLGHLLGMAGGGGVAAGFNGICNSNMDSRQCYSGISSSYQNFPTYSWSVEVVTHEQGHLMGSRHTHACVWNGNNTAIDNCGPTAGYGYEGSCSGATSPGSAGGTIMSYCHLVGGVGINFNNGFGTQPKNVIISRINNGTCLTACSTPTCSMPTGMSTTSITTSSAVFSWTAVSGALSYNVRYKLVTSSTWNNVSTTTASYSATGLVSNSNYEWQVQTVCSGGSSSMTGSTNFTTVALPCDAPTGMNTTAITSSSATFNWTAAPGAMSYNVHYRNIGNQLWTNGSTTGTSLTATGLASSTNHEWQVQTVCASSSSSYTGSTNFTTSAFVCNASTGMSTTAITTTSATFSWSAVSGAVSYNIQYRATGAPNWTTGTATGTSFNAASLAPSTSYEWQVQTVCTGGLSAFTASTLFTTLTSVCTDVYEPNNSKNSATLIPLSTNIFALINPTGEFDWFRFSNTSTQRNIRVTLTNLPTNYNVRLYGNNGNYVAISQNAGTANEIINYNTNTVGTWRIRVDGFNGAFDAAQCYTLRAEISSSPFSSPEGMVGGDIVTTQQSKFNLYPNPAQENVMVELNATTSGIATVNLYTLLGESAFSFAYAVSEGMNSINLNTSEFAEGIYIFEMVQAGEIIRQKLVISK